ncbi:hypothetical protein L1049_027565 [Liquidambar formosana]|uniref:Uncharacterized protein n=1 Tax=Liquidambar formosana TaxID=63359 RepID=A0AAP0RJ07_LIQFO
MLSLICFQSLITLSQIWLLAVMSILWIIWKSRNDVKFNNFVISVQRAIGTVMAWIREGGLLIKAPMGNSILDVQILHSLHLKGIPRRSTKVIPVFWHPPIADWIKVNTDGLSKGNPSIAASGGGLRNYRGFVKGFFGLRLSIQTAFFVELKGVILEVSFAWEKGWHSL